ncbi:hypothetical protein [Candidatus Magnetominusculus dajiuhuensis]|uniref:hypothetical protein n=1 Tax=Candidatus Magnetominusculus dajiuhuensis TaxID=3137712 RepID=UPI0019F39CCF|nr:hypothetical protein [Nitrospirota bacterium]
MAEHFWIQGEDGKFEGSLPGVPKQGGDDNVAKNRKLSPFLQKLRKRMANKRKNSADADSDKNASALINDRQPVSSANSVAGQINSEIDLLKRAWKEANTQKDKMDDVINSMGGTPYEKDAGTVDKYYHCVAHCKTVKLGLTGQVASQVGGLGKELYDIPRKVFGRKYHHLPSAEVDDSIGDMKANEEGRKLGISNPSTPCEELCKDLWPKGIPEKYKR